MLKAGKVSRGGAAATQICMTKGSRTHAWLQTYARPEVAWRASSPGAVALAGLTEVLKPQGLMRQGKLGQLQGAIVLWLVAHLDAVGVDEPID